MSIQIDSLPAGATWHQTASTATHAVRPTRHGLILSPDFPGEWLVVCRNPDLAAERAREREDLLAATERDLNRIKTAVGRKRDPLGSRQNQGNTLVCLDGDSLRSLILKCDLACRVIERSEVRQHGDTVHLTGLDRQLEAADFSAL
jgi:hypothetical protein